MLVGIVAGTAVMWLMLRLMRWIEAYPEKDLMVAGTGLLLGIAVAVYASLKGYPADYDAEGKLIVDGAKMANDTFKGVGYCAGFLVGWVLERRLVGFSTEVALSAKISRALIGLLGYYAVSLILAGLVKPHTTEVACFQGFSPRTAFLPYSQSSAPTMLDRQCRTQAN